MSPEDQKIFAKALMRAGGSASALANILKVTKQSVSLWSHGKTPSGTNMRKMEYFIAGYLDENEPPRESLPRKRASTERPPNVDRTDGTNRTKGGG